MPKIVIFDLDGTLAIIDDRMRLATGGKTTEGNYKKINWDILHDPANIELDVPNVPIVEICRLLAEDGYTIYIFSGRSDKTATATLSFRRTIPSNKCITSGEPFTVNQRQ